MASGEILSANSQENADLWVALRGGGNNLGRKSVLFEVTRFWLCEKPHQVLASHVVLTN